MPAFPRTHRHPATAVPGAIHRPTRRDRRRRRRPAGRTESARNLPTALSSRPPPVPTPCPPAPHRRVRDATRRPAAARTHPRRASVSALAPPPRNRWPRPLRPRPSRRAKRVPRTANALRLTSLRVRRPRRARCRTRCECLPPARTSVSRHPYAFHGGKTPACPPAEQPKKWRARERFREAGASLGGRSGRVHHPRMQRAVAMRRGMGGGLSRTRVRNVLRPFCDSGSLRPSPSVRSLATLVVGEPSQSRLSTASLRAISAAEKLESYDPATQRRIDVLLFRSAGSDLQAVAREAAGVEGVTRVLLADDERHAHGLAEVLAPAIVGVVEKYDHQRVVAGGSTFSKNVLPRVAGLLGVQPLSDVIEVVSAREYVRPVYAGNAMVRVELNESGVGAQPCSVMTVRATSFAAAKPRAPSAAGAETVLVTAAVDEALQRMPPPGSEWVSEQATPADRPALESARIVVSGGRGLRDGDHFNELIYALANKMGAAGDRPEQYPTYAASRPTAVGRAPCERRRVAGRQSPSGNRRAPSAAAPPGRAEARDAPAGETRPQLPRGDGISLSYARAGWAVSISCGNGLALPFTEQSARGARSPFPQRCAGIVRVELGGEVPSAEHPVALVWRKALWAGGVLGVPPLPGREPKSAAFTGGPGAKTLSLASHKVIQVKMRSNSTASQRMEASSSACELTMPSDLSAAFVSSCGWRRRARAPLSPAKAVDACHRAAEPQSRHWQPCRLAHTTRHRPFHQRNDRGPLSASAPPVRTSASGIPAEPLSTAARVSLPALRATDFRHPLDEASTDRSDRRADHRSGEHLHGGVGGPGTAATPASSVGGGVLHPGSQRARPVHSPESGAQRVHHGHRRPAPVHRSALVAAGHGPHRRGDSGGARTRAWTSEMRARRVGDGGQSAVAGPAVLLAAGGGAQLRPCLVAGGAGSASGGERDHETIGRQRVVRERDEPGGVSETGRPAGPGESHPDRSAGAAAD
eukprot:ctg_220.g162